jgi:hypothetical protein
MPNATAIAPIRTRAIAESLMLTRSTPASRRSRRPRSCGRSGSSAAGRSRPRRRTGPRERGRGAAAGGGGSSRLRGAVRGRRRELGRAGAVASRGACPDAASAGRRIERGAHRRDVGRRRAAAAADDRAPARASAATIAPKYAGSGRVDELALDALGQAGVRQDRAGRLAVRRAPNARAPRAAHAARAAVHADHVDRRRGQERRGGRRRRPVGELEVLAERELGDDRQVGRRAARLVDRDQQVPQVDEGLEDEEIDAALEQAVDLLPERLADPGLVERSRSRVGAPSGPTEPATSASRPATSRASRATRAAARLKRCVSERARTPRAGPRFAPNVAGSRRGPRRPRGTPDGSTRRAPAGSWRARRGRPAGGRRSRTAACPSRRRRGAAAPRGAGGGVRARSRAQAYPSAPTDPRRRPNRSSPSIPSRTWGGRGRPLYVEDSDAPYAPASRIATRSPRRSGGRRCSPSASVDSQMGPWTSARSVSFAPGPGRRAAWSTGAPARSGRRCRGGRRRAPGGSARSCPRPTRPGGAARPDVKHPGHEPAGPGHEEPPRLDRQAAAAAGRQAVRRAAPAARGRSARARARVRPAARPGTRRRRPACRNASSPPANERDDRQRPAHAIPPRVDRAQLRSDVEVDAAQPQASGAGERIGRLGQLGLGEAELARPRPTRANRGSRGRRRG